ncbi:hypothetical protein FVEN_g13018 [Fusarium venenatum]|nr:hypothetical protein FVEN_g13018 [Fusarium venenatum]
MFSRHAHGSKAYGGSAKMEKASALGEMPGYAATPTFGGCMGLLDMPIN